MTQRQTSTDFSSKQEQEENKMNAVAAIGLQQVASA
jgi:hypothetical protein